MKIRKIEMKNYRSLRDVTIYPKDILALVGRNNSGKSNVLKALELFFEGTTTLVDEECYHIHETTKPIEIFITFEQLSDWEKEQFKPWISGDKLIIGREISCTSSDSYTVDTIAIVRVPDPEWLQQDAISGDKITGVDSLLIAIPSATTLTETISFPLWIPNLYSRKLLRVMKFKRKNVVLFHFNSFQCKPSFKSMMCLPAFFILR